VIFRVPQRNWFAAATVVVWQCSIMLLQGDVVGFRRLILLGWNLGPAAYIVRYSLMLKTKKGEGILGSRLHRKSKTTRVWRLYHAKVCYPRFESDDEGEATHELINRIYCEVFALMGAASTKGTNPIGTSFWELGLQISSGALKSR